LLPTAGIDLLKPVYLEFAYRILESFVTFCFKTEINIMAADPKLPQREIPVTPEVNVTLIGNMVAK
jgi:hypothetical protein